jgi:hypothetical protein
VKVPLRDVPVIIFRKVIKKNNMKNKARLILLMIATCLVLILNGYATHAEWHEGESCGECHCKSSQVCVEDNEGCGCLPNPGEED